jgi:thiol-disulfide isomerase/thioredoxin
MKTLMAAVLSVVLSSFASFAVCAVLPFNQSQFDATRLAGRPVAVVFHADWCPTCRAQAPVLKELAATPALRSLTLYVANFASSQCVASQLRQIPKTVAKPVSRVSTPMLSKFGLIGRTRDNRS